jgi:hypothetical protein
MIKLADIGVHERGTAAAPDCAGRRPDKTILTLTTHPLLLLLLLQQFKLTLRDAGSRSVLYRTRGERGFGGIRCAVESGMWRKM